MIVIVLFHSLIIASGIIATRSIPFHDEVRSRTDDDGYEHKSLRLLVHCMYMYAFVNETLDCSRPVKPYLTSTLTNSYADMAICSVVKHGHLRDLFSLTTNMLPGSWLELWII